MKRNILGFTLIELLVVISIIGILTTLVAANLNSARSRARDAQRKSDLRNISSALRLYFNDWGVYPRSDAGGAIRGCGPAGLGAPSNTCTYGGTWANGSVTTYMQTLPKDPKSDQVYVYRWLSDDSYTISACLENASDASCKDLTVAGLNCTNKCVFQLTP